ncbi:OmpA family protein [Hymenobacter sp. BT507]|uniref:OmpA family protein n=1 Tax=Hymenobacter citatus TaxID=2763506 RepID=A0ABR7MKE3_9BACT|nr:OmpA family protein [Hymenobacter citatus]MBC6611526.1 OmpA family protein [Hymenobacter citatus]
MGKSLLQTVKSCFTAQQISQISATVRENEAGVEQVVNQAATLVVQHLMARAQRPGGTEVLATLAQEAYRAGVLHHLADLHTTDWQRRGLDLMQGLLGDAYALTLNRLSVSAYVEPTAARTLLGTVAAATLAALGRYAAEQELSVQQLSSYLQNQPEELGAIGAAAWHPVSAGTPELAPRPTPELVRAGVGSWGTSPASPEPVEGGRAATSLRWQWGLLLLLAVSLGYYFGHERLSAVPGTVAFAGTAPTPAATTYAGTENAATATSTAATGHYDSESDSYIYDTGQPVILQLANGTTQKVGARSTENRLYTFLAEPSIQVDPVNRTKGWINFDRVYFEPAKAVLTAESHQQLVNVAGILKSFPKAVVKIGGYTDSLGNDLQNLHLSEERARAAMFALADMGIPVAQLQAKGYGSKHSLTSNETVEGRALNRRISIRVVKK